MLVKSDRWRLKNLIIFTGNMQHQLIFADSIKTEQPLHKFKQPYIRVIALVL